MLWHFLDTRLASFLNFIWEEKSFSLCLLRYFLFSCRKASMVHTDERWWCQASSALESGKISSVLGKMDIVVTWKEKDSPWEECLWLGQEDRYCRPPRRLSCLLWDQRCIFWNCLVAGQFISHRETNVWTYLLCLWLGCFTGTSWERIWRQSQPSVCPWSCREDKTTSFISRKIVAHVSDHSLKCRMHLFLECAVQLLLNYLVINAEETFSVQT